MKQDSVIPQLNFEVVAIDVDGRTDLVKVDQDTFCLRRVYAPIFKAATPTVEEIYINRFQADRLHRLLGVMLNPAN